VLHQSRRALHWRRRGFHCGSLALHRRRRCLFGGIFWTFSVLAIPEMEGADDGIGVVDGDGPNVGQSLDLGCTVGTVSLGLFRLENTYTLLT
jgi:hypothetical protein